MQIRTDSKQGSALFLVLAIVGVIAALTGAVALSATSNLRQVSGESTDDKAKFIAQAGVQAALARLSVDRHWPTSSQPKGQGNAWSTADYNYDEDHLGLWSNSDPSIHAAILVYNNTSAAFYRTPQAPDGTDIPEGRILIISKGIVDGDTRGERQSTTVSALAKPAGVRFEDAVLGGDRVYMTNSFVDVVDSSDPTWTPASYAPYDMTTNPLGQADIASNNTVTDSIRFDSTCQVDGDVFAGPNAPLGAIGYYGGTKTGIDGTLVSSRDLNELTVPGTATLLGSPITGHIITTGPTALAGGVYHIQGNLTIQAGAELTLTSTTTLYVDGDINIDTANVNMNGKPWHLQIFSTGGNANIRNSNVSLLLSGPNTTMSVENSNLFGAVIGDRVQIQDSGIHYDRSVSEMFLGTSGWTVDTFFNRSTIAALAISAPPGGAPSDPLTAQPPLPPTTGPAPATPPPGTPGPTNPGPPAPTTPVAGPPSTPPTGNPNPQPPPPPWNPWSGTPPPFMPNPQCCLDYSCGPPMCIIY